MQTAFDRDRTAPPPSTWTAEHVRARLVEAFEIQARLPEPPGPSRGGSTWPTTYREFADLAGYADAARAAVWADWGRARGALPYEVSRMDEALEWLAWLATVHPGEHTCLKAWAFRTARGGAKLRKEIRRRGGSHATFYRKRNAGAERIAARLNDRAVAVR